jgi:CheY-like chemotaxis protein
MDQLDADSKTIGAGDVRGGAAASDGRAKVSAMSNRRSKVLVVDDNEVCRAVVRETLEEAGFDVIELGSPVGLSSVVNHEKPDVVLMDIEMPAIDGHKAVEILLKHRLHDCKILLYSGRPAAELQHLARACGASGFVPKSVTDAALAKAIRAHLVP